MRFPTLALTALLLLAAVALLWLGVRRSRDRFHYYVSGRDPTLTQTLAVSRYELQELSTAPGVRIQLALRRPSAQGEPFLLLFPGNVDRQLATGLPILEGVRAGHAAGAAVVSYRGFDGSTGAPGPRAAAHDARAIVEYLDRELGVRGKQLVILGYSMGSGIALRIAAELAQRGQEPDALLLLSPFWILELQPAGFLGALMPSDLYTVEEVIPYLRSRTIVLGAGRDSALPVALHARPLAAALATRAQYLELPEADHASYLHDPAVITRLAQLIWRDN